MSVPGAAREKYTHQVKFVGQKKHFFKLIVACVGLLLVGLLIYACCNISNMRSQIHELRRMMHRHGHHDHRHHHQDHNMPNHEQHHDQGGDHHHHHHGHERHHHPHPHHNGPRDGQRRSSEEKIAIELREMLGQLREKLTSFEPLRTRLPTIEQKVDEIANELRSRQDFSKRIFTQLKEFQTYIKDMLQPLKMSNWFQ